MKVCVPVKQTLICVFASIINCDSGKLLMGETCPGVNVPFNETGPTQFDGIGSTSTIGS